LIRILGIDPGSRRTGIGIVDSGEDRVLHVHHDVVATFDEEFPARLKDIFDGVLSAIREWRPATVAIETVFLAKNPSSALKLGQARGAAICAAVSAGLPVAEYAPRAIKQAVVGSGAADKVQVQHMVGVLLSLTTAMPADAADALAVALTHAHHSQTAQRLGPLAQLPTRRGSRRWR
jgi:crossover junction endodeoxyribonuclease RuvC